MSTNNPISITENLVQELIAEQFPQWSHLSIKAVAVGGSDNRTFHLGAEMSVRLPSAEGYVAQVEKEHRWLPKLAAHLSIPISQPIALGKPSRNYPWPWSIYRWIEGTSANTLALNDANLKKIAPALAQFLHELHKIDTAGGPLPCLHNYWRGADLIGVIEDFEDIRVKYDSETRTAINALHNLIDAERAIAVWETARSSRWHKNPVWIHGDLSSGNILIKDAQLAAVIDFGCMGIGDPACDLVIAWTLLQGESRKNFKEQINLDPDTWARARGWALWKALITLVAPEDRTTAEAAEQLRIITDILAEHVAENR